MTDRNGEDLVMRKRRFRVLGLLLPLAFVAAGCGGDDDSDEGAEEEEDAAPFEAISYDESAQCGTPEYAGNLAGLEAVDEHTVVFTLCNPDVAFPSKMAFAAMHIYPSEALDEIPAGGPNPLVDNPIGTGPYRLQAWERGSQIVLERNKDYWGEASSLATVVFQWQTEPAQRRIQLESGTAQGIDNVGTEDFDTIESNPIFSSSSTTRSTSPTWG